MKTRVLVPEWMDDPQLARADHFQALRGLQRINAWSQHSSLTWVAIQHLARRLDRRKLCLLDIATGAADIPIRLWHRARSIGLELDIDACDVSGQALEFAAENCRRAKAALKFRELDILNQSIEQQYDVVMCSQFFHHLPDEQAGQVLGKMAAAATQSVIVIDLVRSRFNWLQVWLATRALSRSRIVHFDGPQSIRAAFTIDEMREIAARIGLRNYSIKSHWPCRFVLIGDVSDV